MYRFKNLNKLRAVTTLSLFILLGAGAFGEDLWVPGQYASISEAVEAASPGVDRVVVTDGGTYDESVVLHKDLTLVSEPAGATIQSSLGDGISILTSASLVSIEGFIVSNCKKNGILVKPGGKNSVSLTLVNTRVDSNNWDGLAFNSGESHKLRAEGNCSFSGNKRSGIRSARKIEMRLTGCQLSENGEHGLRMGKTSGPWIPDGASRLILENCFVTSNKDKGIYLFGRLDNRVEILNSVIDSNKFGIHLDHGKGFHSKLRMSNCSVSDNKSNGLRIGELRKQGKNPKNAGNVKTGRANTISIVPDEVILTDACRVQRNYGGVVIFKPAEFSALDSSVFGNRRFGLQTGGQNHFCDSDEAATLTLSNCTISSNTMTGINLTTGLRSVLAVEDSLVELNTNGIRVSAAEDRPARIRMDRTKVRNNSGLGLAIKEFYCLAARDTGRPKGGSTTGSGLGLRSRNCGAVFNDCDFSGNDLGEIGSLQSGGVVVSAAFNWGLLPEGVVPDVFTKGPALDYKPFIRGGFPGLTFSDLEKDFDHYDSDAAFFQIADLFARNQSVSREASGSKALAYARSHPDDALSCRLLQNLLVDALDWTLPEDCKSLAAFVREHPNSAAADAICTLIGMEQVYYPASAQSAREFALASEAPRDSLAGTLTAAFRLEGDTQVSAFERFRSAYVKTSAKYAFQRAKSRGKVTHRSQISEKEGLESFIQRTEALAILLSQAKALHRLGKNDDAEQFFSLAQGERLGFQLASPETHFLPHDLNVLFQNTRDALREDSTTGIDQILEMTLLDAKQFGPRNYLNERIGAFATIVSLPTSGPDYSEMQSAQSPRAVRNDILGIFMEEFAGLINAGMEPEIFSKYGFCLKNDILPFFPEGKKATTLKWLERRVQTAMSKPTRLSVRYHGYMQKSYKNTEDFTSEAEQLELTIKTAQERLTALYLDYWELPKKAVEVQREIAKLHTGTKKEYEARLQIARIYYAQKEFERAVYELTELLERIPETYFQGEIRSLLGLAFLGNQNYADARKQFETVIASNRKEKREKCLYLTGYSYISEQNYKKAVQPLKELIRLYPKGLYAKKAQSLLEKFEEAGVGG